MRVSAGGRPQKATSLSIRVVAGWHVPGGGGDERLSEVLPAFVQAAHVEMAEPGQPVTAVVLISLLQDSVLLFLVAQTLTLLSVRLESHCSL